MNKPKKQQREHRTKSIRTSVTVAEKAYVQQQATAAGISDAEYLRRRALDYTVSSHAEKRSRAAFISEINRLGNQIAALGNVVNQVALYCHTDRQIPAAWSVLPSEIKALGHSVEEILERIVFNYDSQNP